MYSQLPILIRLFEKKYIFFSIYNEKVYLFLYN